MHIFLYFLNGIIFFRHCQISKMFLFSSLVPILCHCTLGIRWSREIRIVADFKPEMISNHSHFFQSIHNKKVKVYVCVCMSGGLPPDIHSLSPQNLAWAPHFTQACHQARWQPKMLAHSLAHSPTHFCSLVP